MSGNAAAGGSMIRTSENGRAPFFADKWENTGLFTSAANYRYWTNRAAGGNTEWGLVPASGVDASTCSGFASTAGSATYGRSFIPGQSRWNISTSSCNNTTTYHLICVVHP